MKKTVAAMLSALLLLSLAACGESDSGMENGSASKTSFLRSTVQTGCGVTDRESRYGNTQLVPIYRQEETEDSEAPMVRYRLMLKNGHPHDRDGFLLDGENSRHDTF